MFLRRDCALSTKVLEVLEGVLRVLEMLEGVRRVLEVVENYAVGTAGDALCAEGRWWRVC